jgi:LDH2 family malate/lactate/ureidoglycolate dehydrogenase
MVAALRATPPADPALPVLIPGDPEMTERKRRLREGVPIPATLDRHIRDICERCGAPYVLQAE